MEMCIGDDLDAVPNASMSTCECCTRVLDSVVLGK